MTKRNKKKQEEQLLQEEVQVVETPMEKSRKEQWEEFKNKSKQKYDEIIEDLKNPVKKAVRRRKVGSKIVSILRGFIFFGLSFVIFYPIFQELSVAFKNPIDLNNKLVNFIPENYSLFNVYISAEVLDYWRSLWNNLQVSAISTICQLFATALAGYALSRLKFRGSNIIFWIIMLTLIVPPQAVAMSRSFYLGNFDIFGFFENLLGHSLKLKGEGRAIVFYLTSLTGQGIRSALFIFMFRQFFRGIPVELEESAQIDGAGVVRTFASVMLPNARGVITTVALFAFVWQWNDVYYTGLYEISGNSFPMLTSKMITASERLQSLLDYIRMDLNHPYRDLVIGLGEGITKNPLFNQAILNTSALMMLAPILIAYLFVQRLFIEGVERSGIVG